jgi:hypothetical protein
VQGIDPRYIVAVHGQPMVRYAGLLQRAREEGLIELRADFVLNDDKLAIAHAVAIFKDGRRFEESSDATPTNASRVKDAWRRMALTRAKSRALRDALGLGELCAVEEMDIGGEA